MRRSIRTLRNKGFSVGYDRARRRAAWVAYTVHPVADFKRMPRPAFVADPRLGAAGDNAIYAGPEYDRGHLAPNYAIGQLYGETAQRQTFYASNIVPQRPRLNQLVWQRLEEIEVDEIAPRVERLWVLAGPIAPTGGGPPVGFFRIWLASNGDGRWQAMAFRVPQTVRGDERLDRFLVAIDDIERATKLDFLSRLDARDQRRLESRPAASATFGFIDHACQPARYRERWGGRDGVNLRYDRCDHPVDRAGHNASSRGRE